jgi:hypothetical protein
MSEYDWIDDGRAVRLARRRRTNALAALVVSAGALALAVSVLWPVFAPEPWLSYSETGPGISVRCDSRVWMRSFQVRISWERPGALPGSCFIETEDFPGDVGFWWDPSTARLRLAASDHQTGQWAAVLLDFAAGHAVFDGREQITVRATTLPRVSERLPTDLGQELGRWTALPNLASGSARTRPVAYVHWSPRVGATTLRKAPPRRGHFPGVVIESSDPLYRDGELRELAPGWFAFYGAPSAGRQVRATLDERGGKFTDERQRAWSYDPVSCGSVRLAAEHATSYPQWSASLEGGGVIRPGSGGPAQ